MSLQMSCSSQEMMMLSLYIATQAKGHGTALSPPFLFHSMHNVSGNIVSSPFKIDAESNLFSWPPLLPL